MLRDERERDAHLCIEGGREGEKLTCFYMCLCRL